MTEYEWEMGRAARRTKPEFLGTFRPRPRELEEYVALEHPREHVGWLLREHSREVKAAAEPSAPPTSRKTTAVARSPARPEPEG
jgi:hypothetical protein